MELYAVHEKDNLIMRISSLDFHDRDEEVYNILSERNNEIFYEECWYYALNRETLQRLLDE